MCFDSRLISNGCQNLSTTGGNIKNITANENETKVSRPTSDAESVLTADRANASDAMSVRAVIKS